MNPKDSKKVLWDNVSRLMVARYGKENLTRLSQDAKIGPATCTRIKKQTTSVGTDVIEAVAKALKVSTWQLLVVGLDPKDLPTLQPGTGPQVAEPTSVYNVTTPAEAIRVLSQVLLVMAPAARARAATILSTMASDPEGPWAAYLSDLVERESLPTTEKTGITDREGNHPADSSNQGHTIDKKAGAALGAALAEAIKGGDDFNKSPGAPESRSGDNT